MNKKLLAVFITLLFAQTFAQSANEKVIVVNSGKFEFAQPFDDYVTVGVYNPFTKQYKTIDTIASQSAQGVLVDGKSGFVISENVITKYDFKTEQRIQTGTFHGVSPKSLAVSNNKLLIGNWYGKTDSSLYIYNATTLALEHVVAEITKEVKAILIIGDTAFVAQNISGTIDNCAPYGCYNDTIGQISLVRVSTGAFIGTVSLETESAGINSIFKHGNSILTVNAQANSISKYNPANNTFTNHAISGDLEKGIVIVNNELYVNIDGNIGIFNVQSNQVTSSNLTPIDYPTATVYDHIHGKFYQSVTDYSSYGSLIASKQNIVLDSAKVGISPEALGLYYTENNKPVATDDFVLVRYDKDTLIDVLANDIDSNFAPLSVTYLSAHLIFGAEVSVDSATGKVHYIPALGVEANDEITYIVCDVAQLCDTAKIFIQVAGVTAINESSFENIALYPNPFNSNINFEGINENAVISVLNINGAVMLNAKGTKSINTEQLASGIYFIRVEQNSVFKISKMIKE
jgi:hypothetical protein